MTPIAYDYKAINAALKARGNRDEGGLGIEPPPFDIKAFEQRLVEAMSGSYEQAVLYMYPDEEPAKKRLTRRELFEMDAREKAELIKRGI